MDNNKEPKHVSEVINNFYQNHFQMMFGENPVILERAAKDIENPTH